MKKRRATLLRHARRLGCDTLVAFEPENVFYMTGFWGEATAVLGSTGTILVSPGLEAERAAADAADCDVIPSERGRGLADTLGLIKGASVCTDTTDYAVLKSLKKTARITPSQEPFYNSRMIKDESEIRILARASRLIDEMFGLCQNQMKAGQKESQMQAVLMSYAAQNRLFDTGYRYTLNPLIVAGGPNAALPHAQVTDRKFRRGDLVVVDITLRYKGYVSDATRTFSVGTPGAEARDIYNTVKESQILGRRRARPGIQSKSVDHACRQYIEECGYGKYFIHATGHGIGLEVHEDPAISAAGIVTLKKNMAITVEPGIYVPGSLGVRIEDSIIVKDRPSILHRFTRDLVSV